MYFDVPVLVKVFKTEDIEYTDGGSVVSGVRLFLEDGFVDLFHQPHKHTTIDALDKGISYI